MQVLDYNESESARWDDCCQTAYMSTFIHTRGFLSYHGDRFKDMSLLIEQKGELVGVFPAAQDLDDPSMIVSHPGLTYGGILHNGFLRGGKMLNALSQICSYYYSTGYRLLQYKVVPGIYHQVPADDDIYALSRLGARRERCELSSTIDFSNRLKISQRRQRGLKKAKNNQFEIRTGVEYAASIWKVLRENLKRKHGVEPVHTIDEIVLLHERFPKEIKFYAGLLNGSVETGIVIFESANVSHVQYSASSKKGYELSGLDYLYNYCINESCVQGKRFFDFGISTEEQGRFLNEGLYEFKKEFGAGSVIHECYELDLEG